MIHEVNSIAKDFQPRTNPQQLHMKKAQKSLKSTRTDPIQDPDESTHAQRIQAKNHITITTWHLRFRPESKIPSGGSWVMNTSARKPLKAHPVLLGQTVKPRLQKAYVGIVSLGLIQTIQVTWRTHNRSRRNKDHRVLLSKDQRMGSRRGYRLLK